MNTRTADANLAALASILGITLDDAELARLDGVVAADDARIAADRKVEQERLAALRAERIEHLYRTGMGNDIYLRSRLGL